MHVERPLAKRPFVTRAALLTLTAGLSLGASMAQAQVVDSGLLATPINVPNTTAGIYLNLVTGTTGGTGTATPGWDFNPWGSTSAPAGLALFWPTPAAQHGAVATGTVVDNVAVGTTISAASTFSTTGGAANFANIRAGGTIYVGIRFLNETGSSLHYGYVQMTTTSPSGFPAQIVRYVFEATPNTAITVTAPGGGPGNVAPIFGYAPGTGTTVAATGGTTIGSTGNLTITPSIATAGSGTGAAATTTLTCTPPTGPFAGFNQTVTAVGSGAISGGPLAGTCTLGAQVATATLTCSENQGGTPVTRTWTLSCPAGSVPNVPPVFGYTPAAGSTVTATGGTGLVGSTSNLTITPSIQTAGTGTGAAATTTLTCTAPAAPFSGFGQTVTAIGTGAISGGPLAGTCTRGTAAATATLTCSENRGGESLTRTWSLNCPAGTIPSVPVNATSAWSLIALMLALFGFAAVAVRRQG